MKGVRARSNQEILTRTDVDTNFPVASKGTQCLAKKIGMICFYQRALQYALGVLRELCSSWCALVELVVGDGGSRREKGRRSVVHPPGVCDYKVILKRVNSSRSVVVIFFFVVILSPGLRPDVG